MSALQPMPWAQYLATPRLNFSTLKHMERSPAHYRWARSEQGIETKALATGRLVHLLVLEPEKADAEVAVYGGTRRGKAWDDFVRANLGRNIVTQSEWDEAAQLAEAVRSNPDAARLLTGGTAEQTVLWEVDVAGGDTFPAKGRLDYLSSAHGVVDLKTTRDASPRAFARAVVQYGYHAQAAWYLDGLRAALDMRGEDVPYRIVAVEKSAPYAVGVYVLPPEAIAAGRALYRSWLVKLDECEAADRWPGYTEGEQVLALPEWATQDQAEETE